VINFGELTKFFEMHTQSFRMWMQNDEVWNVCTYVSGRWRPWCTLRY